jgi:CRP-like cAMP-binding protein
MAHKADENIVNQIRSWPQAASLTDKDVKTVARLVRLTSVPSGWAFIREGTPGDAAYLILSGTADILIGGKKVASIGPGDVTGEIALARGGLRTATVAATTPCTFLHVERDDFEELKRSAPAAHALFVRYVEERVAALSER